MYVSTDDIVSIQRYTLYQIDMLSTFSSCEDGPIALLL
jgi:hypothetical protein